ncbi:hypothetical protein [Pseudoalteromonas aurantia]|uniref:Lipoprotein n=1 Tax=Pseudoalteromonas aurantia TaxID=43654 RepID=A0A5S3V7H0_9GAMM|nr:hypothetical protein [Pseudoalteromonas aurantia]TMO56846.1 hypothetical protein CWC18_19135 [Pseudoalteromonas aurantia]TMO66825.1 hypothetical protein CWC19_15425 [Pseudoalteromonas aurantia]TMO70155.1 hypothetical protein CWC20_19850 [Pseudoalteromonas aurantia]
MFKYILSFYMCLLAGCAASGPADKNTVPELVNENRPLIWFSERNVDEVLSLHRQQQSLGLIALSRRGYFYPKIGMARKPLTLQDKCVTWLLASSSDIVNDKRGKALMAAQQQFAAKFNMAMAPNCLK